MIMSSHPASEPLAASSNLKSGAHQPAAAGVVGTSVHIHCTRHRLKLGLTLGSKSGTQLGPTFLVHLRDCLGHRQSLVAQIKRCRACC